MKKNSNIFKYLSLLSIPLVITSFSTIGSLTNTNLKASDMANTVTKTIYNGVLYDGAANKSTLNLTISNTEYGSTATTGFTSSNSLFVYGIIDFKDATEAGKTNMRDLANWSTTYEYMTTDGKEIGPSSSIIEFNMDPELIGEATSTQILIQTTLPAFDLAFKTHVHYNEEGDFSVPADIHSKSTNVYQIGSSFSSVTSIVQPAYVFEQNIGALTGGDTFAASSFKVYAPAETMTFLRLFLATGNAAFNGGIYIENSASEKFFATFGQATVTYDTIESVINIAFPQLVLTTSNTFIYNPFAPNTTLVSQVPTVTSTSKVFGEIVMNWNNIDVKGNAATTNPSFTRIIQPVNLTGIDIAQKTPTTTTSSNDGVATVKYTATPTLSISTTSITTNVWNRSGYSFSSTSTGAILPSTEQVIDATNMGMGYFYTSFNLNAKISSQTTSLVMGNQKDIKSAQANVIPTAINTVTFDSLTSPTVINGIVAVDEKSATISGATKTSVLNTEQSKVSLFYNGSLVEDLTLVAPDPLTVNGLAIVSYTFTYNLTDAQKLNISLFSINSVLYYDIVNGTTVEQTVMLNSNFITDSGNSIINTQIPSSNGGLSVGAIVGIVIGSLAAVGLLAWIVMENKKKKAKNSTTTKPHSTTPSK